MYYPTLDEVYKLKRHGNLVPVYHEIMADLETPVSAYLKVARGNYSFLLESIEGGEQLVGRIVVEGAAALTLEKGDGEQVEVAIASITERRAGLSAMPGDLEQALDRFEMRDLIESLSRR